MDEVSDLKRGAFFVLTSGDYSDYQILCVAQALSDFNLQEARNKCGEELQEWKVYLNPGPNAGPNAGYFKRPSVSRFMVWLEQQGLAKELDASEFNTDYTWEKEKLKSGHIYSPVHPLRSEDREYNSI